MASPGAFFDGVVADLVEPPTSPGAPTASSSMAAPTMGEIGENAGPSTSGAPAGDLAGLPSLGAAALVEPVVADEDLAPPVMGVPPSSDEEEELLADIVGAHQLPGVDVIDGEAQTAHFTPILAFDAHDVGVQTANEVMFSSFVGDTSEEALATAIRALSRDDRDRLVGALRLAEEQPLVDVAPSGGAGDPPSSSGLPLDLLDLTPGQSSGPTGVEDPGPSPATARTKRKEQDATAVAEMAAAKPVPDDDIDAGPPTSLEVFLAEQAAAASATASPPDTEASSSLPPGLGPKKPFMSAPPPALVLEEPPKAAPKAPPMPCPDKPIRFLEDPPAVPKPTVKRPPAGAKVPPRFDAQGQVVEQKPVGLRRRLGTRRSPSRMPRLVGRPLPLRQVGLRPIRPRWWAELRHLRKSICAARRSSASSRWRAVGRDCSCCPRAPPTRRRSRAASPGSWRNNARRQTRLPSPGPSPRGLRRIWSGPRSANLSAPSYGAGGHYGPSCAGGSFSPPARGHHPSRGAADLVFGGFFYTALGAYPVDFDSSGAFGHRPCRWPGDIVCRRPPATDFAIPAGRQGGPGGLWHQEPESPTACAGTQHLGRLPVPAPPTGGGSLAQGDSVLRRRVDGRHLGGSRAAGGGYRL